MKKLKVLIVLFIVFMFSIVNVHAANIVKLDKAPYLSTGRKVNCGDELVKGLPEGIVTISSTLYNAVMIVVPVIIIVFGVVDLVKAIMAQKEDDIKKGRENLVKRIITAVIIFLVVMIVKFATGVFAGNDGADIVDCIDCFISADCDIGTATSNSTTSNSTTSNSTTSNGTTTSNNTTTSNSTTTSNNANHSHGGGGHRR